MITISGAVTTRADGLSVPGAVVSVVGGDATATTDASGRYTLQVPRSLVRGDRVQLQGRRARAAAEDHRRGRERADR